MPESNKHRHVIISVSGFLSQTSDAAADWHFLMNYCKAMQLPLYALRWESKDTSELTEIVKDSAEKTGILDLVKRASKWSEVLSVNSIKSLANFAADTWYGGYESFKEARFNAKMSGKLLAHFLASHNDTFQGHSVTLVGFSLGSQVSKSCVNRLAKLG